VGHKLKPGENWKVITKEFAIELLHKDVAGFESALYSLIKVPLSQNQFDALVSFIFNIGMVAFAKSTMLRLLNEGQYDEAADQFLRWIWASNPRRVVSGLLKRRRREQSLFIEEPGGAHGTTG
jgi:GH24 family phage-related lysozyme (muramidase)